MSTDKQNFAGTAKAPPDKSNFAQTCNRLSLFLKEKGSLRDLSIGISGKLDDKGKSPETTMTCNFLRNMQNQGQGTARTEKSMNLLPQYASLDSFMKLEGSRNKATPSEPVAASGSRNAQMTIFYGGQVVVFEDIPENKARDVMAAAGSRTPSTTGKVESKHPSDASRSKEPIQGNDLDLPIARRASLHKFMAKRKDRATVRAPYQLHNPAAGPSMNEHKFDLNVQPSPD